MHLNASRRGLDLLNSLDLPKDHCFYSNKKVEFSDGADPLADEGRHLWIKSAGEQKDISLDEFSTDKKYMVNKSGKSTIPQIFVNDEYKGTFEELEEINDDGKDALVAWLEK